MIIKSADVLIDSSSKIARRYGVSSFIIGITVVAFGTSAPELAVGIVSGINCANQLTLGNIIGSSLSNIALIVGLAAVIFPLEVKDTIVKRELPLLLIIQVALGAMMFLDGHISRIEGLILLGSFVLFMLYISRDARKSIKIHIDTNGDIDTDGDPDTDENGRVILPQSNSEQKNAGLMVIYPISSDRGLWIDVPVMLALTLFVFIMSLLHKKLKRPTGILLLAGYAVYLTFKKYRP